MGVRRSIVSRLCPKICGRLYYGDLSNGKFDITIGKLSDLWDISTKALLEKTDASMIPSDDEIKKALTTVDYQNVVVDGNTVTLKDPSAKIDLGGIAKGYIADRMKDYLNQKGAACGYINLGGNVLCLGAKPDGSSYNIGIQRPFDDEGDRKSTRLNSSHNNQSRMPSSA